MYKMEEIIMLVICKNTRCRFCKGGCCSRQYVRLNQIGGCSLWFTKDGMLSRCEIVEPDINSNPEYRGDAATEADGAIEQGSPHLEKEGVPAENEPETEKSESTEKDEG
jgi:hypothetical protein